MGIEVRAAQEEDAEKAAALMNSFISEGRFTALTELRTTEAEVDLIRQLAKEGVYTVATDGEEIIGIQMVFPFSVLPAFQHVGDIGTWVTPASHRSGVGRALAQWTFERAKDVGFSKLIAMIRGDNHRAIEFYKGLGFEYIGLAKKQACIRGVFYDEVFMERPLD